jgi:mannose-1-phosphate guanylyltransferase
VMGVAYLKDEIIKFFEDGSRFGVNIRYSVHTVEGGTGEGFRLAISRNVKDENFAALNGDQITDLQLSSMVRHHEENAALATIAVVHPRLPFGEVLIGPGGYCEGFSEKPILKDVFISSGIYVFNKEILKYLPTKGDVEKTTFPQLTQLRRLRAYSHDGSFITVNSLRELEEAEEQVKRLRKK